MDWNKAKKIILLVLVILNAVLFVLNRYYNTDYRITQSEENAVYKLLSQNEIGIYTDLIDEYKPMKELDVTVVAPNIEELKRMFFNNGETVEIEVEFDKTILRSYSATLIAKDSQLKYECPTGTGETIGLGKDAARKLSESFMKQMGDNYSNYSLDRITYKNGGYQLEYYEYYKGYKVFCNYCIFFIDDSGIRTIDFENYEINGFVEHNRDICSSVEAVLTYIYDGKNFTPGEKFIENIEIGYALKEFEQTVDGSKLRLVPCYYIHLLNQDEPFVVYAYSNTAKSEILNMTDGGVILENDVEK